VNNLQDTPPPIPDTESVQPTSHSKPTRSYWLPTAVVGTILCINIVTYFVLMIEIQEAQSVLERVELQEADIKQLEAKRIEISKGLPELRQKFEQAIIDQQEIEAAIKLLDETHAEYQKESDSLQSIRTKIETQKSILADLKKTAAETTQRIIKFSTKENRAQIDFENTQKKKQNVLGQLDKLEYQKSQAENQVKQLENKETKLTDTITSLDSRLSAKKNDDTILKNSINNAKVELREVNSELSQIKSEQSRIKSATATEQTKLDNLKRQTQQLDARANSYSNLESQLESLQQKVGNEQSQLNQLKEKVGAEKGNLAGIQNEKTSLQTIINELNKEKRATERAKGVKAELEIQIQKLSKEIGTKETKLSELVKEIQRRERELRSQKEQSQ
jgi:chromosome segregation ATPase